MDILGTLLWPIRWVIELILVGFHNLWTFLGLDGDDGWTWILAITGLVIVVRAAMIPLMVKQIKAQRNMLVVAPEIKKIQDKYKGKRDQFSMEAMRRETMAVYSKNGANPMASCWPLLVQMPIFFGLFSVLNGAQHDAAGAGLLTPELASSFANSSIWGAPLKATFMDNGGNVAVMVIAAVMVVVMTVSQFITQKQIMSKNISQATKESPMYKQQQMLLYVLPLVFAVSGVTFPLGVMSYWLVSNFWTMGQQYVVIRQMPTPGSEAAKAREERLKRRGKWVEEEGADKGKGGPGSGGSGSTGQGQSGQRQQPVSKARAKKQGGGKGQSSSGGGKASGGGSGESSGRSGSSKS